MNKHALKKLLLPYTRHQLPGWGKALKHLGRVDREFDEEWVGSPKVTIRGKKHGYLMELDLEDWSARRTFFLGEYFELHVLRILDMVLCPGDRFIDIGSNIGMVALHGAHLVGSDGRVDCFEPNPVCCTQIKRTTEMNNISQIQVHCYGLSEMKGSLELNQDHAHTGGATFGKVDSDKIVSKTVAEVRKGDDVFVGNMAERPKLIKIDVEGYELYAMRGMTDTLARWGCPILMELVEENLVKAGATVHELVGFMGGLGYVPMNVHIDRKIYRQQLIIERASGKYKEFSRDVLWTQDPGDPLRK